MADTEQQAAAGSAASAAETVQAPTDGATTEIERVRREAAGYRVERNQLRDRIAELEKRTNSAEAESVQSKARIEAARQKLMQAAVKSAAVAAGVTDAEQLDVILPGLVAKAQQGGVTVSDDLDVSGDLDSVVAAVAAKFAGNRGGTAHPAAQNISRHLPNSAEPPESENPRERLAAALRRARIA